MKYGLADEDIEQILVVLTNYPLVVKIENPDLVAHIGRVGLVFYQKVAKVPCD